MSACLPAFSRVARSLSPFFSGSDWIVWSGGDLETRAHCTDLSDPACSASVSGTALQAGVFGSENLLLEAFVEWTGGYTRKHAIKLLNHRACDQQTIQRHRQPQYGKDVQQVLFQVWKATHYVCAKRLPPSLPAFVTLLERYGHLHLTEEEHHQLLTMSVSTAERYLRTQRKPRMYGLSTTTPGLLRKPQVPIYVFTPWEEGRPGFIEVDLITNRIHNTL